MAATGIRVTPEQLQQISAQLDAGASSIEGTLRELAGNVAPLGSDWAGVAQAASSSSGPSGSAAAPPSIRR
jgi:WXG100 family type VII secretion target